MTMLFATHGSSAAFFACILLELALVITDLGLALLVAGLEFMTHFGSWTCCSAHCWSWIRPWRPTINNSTSISNEPNNAFCYSWILCCLLVAGIGLALRLALLVAGLGSDHCLSWFLPSFLVLAKSKAEWEGRVTGR